MTVLSVTLFLLLSASVAAGCNLTVSFACDEDRCVPRKWLCDDHPDCLDETDEDNCDICKNSTEFQCANGKCIPKSWKCDEQDDCGDGSDEVNCTCASGKFQCPGDRTCIPIEWRCDGGIDCNDESDEEGCPSLLTTESSQAASTVFITSTECSGFQCLEDGACVHQDSVCDGIPDCSDHSDENDCDISTTISPGLVTSEDCDGFLCEPGGTCIPGDWLCDGDRDCGNNADEQNCSSTIPPVETTDSTESPCEDKEFQCESDVTVCIPDTWVCDGDGDCPDLSDEKNCIGTTSIAETATTSPATPGTSVPPASLSSIISPTAAATTTTSTTKITTPVQQCPHFQCKTGPVKCIHWSWLCDGHDDCEDGSDEEENCSSTVTIATPFTPPSPSTSAVSQSSAVLTSLSPTSVSATSPSPSPTTSPPSCDPGHFQCGDDPSGPCLPRSARCDGGGQCQDLSDELTCQPSCIVTAPDRVSCLGVNVQLLTAEERVVRLFNVSSASHRELWRTDKPGIVAVDFHYRRQYIFWTDQALAQLNRLDLSNNSVVTVVSDMEAGGAEGVAVDWVHQHVYWVDAYRQHIGVAKLDGSLSRVLVNDSLHSPRAIVVHPGKRFVFFSDWGTSPGKIERCDLNGQHRVNIINTNIGWPNGMTIDYEESLLYWVDARRETISCADFEGHNRRVVLTSDNMVAHPLSLAVFRDKLLWSESGWMENTVYRYPLASARAQTEEFASGVANPLDITFYHPARQFPYPNVCGVNNGGCSDFCLPDADGSITCVCRDGYLPHPSNSSRCVSESMELHEETSTPATTTTTTTTATTNTTPLLTTTNTTPQPTSTTNPSTATQPPGTTSSVSHITSKKGSMFYMLLMGFRAESESQAISMFEILKNTARNASSNSIALLKTA